MRIVLKLLKILYFQAFLFLVLSVSYATTIRGISNSEILNLIKSQISNWEDFSNDSISTKFKLKKDKKIIKDLLASYGYFDATVDPKQKNGKIIFHIKLNERYKFDDVLLIYVDHRKYRSGLKVGQVFDLINIEFDTYTDTKQLADGRDKIENFLKKRGFAFVKITPPKIETDKKDKKIKAVYEIILNGKTIIDKTIVNIKSKKDPKLLESFVKNRISWKNGDVYDFQKIIDTKEDLMSSGIFSGIDIKLSNPVLDEKDEKISHTTLTMDIEEALLRDVSAGVKYGTSEKAGILFSWTHYNIDGKGSKLSLLADIAKESRISKIKYDIYDVFYKKQKLANQIFYLKEDVSAYDVSKIGAESILWQTFGQKFQLGAGLCFEKSKTKDKVDTTHLKFNAFGTPIGLNFDTTDEYLDPQKGLRCFCMTTPYFGNLTNITVFSGKASLYLPIRKNSFKNSMVLAIYSKFGSIFRNKNHKVPRDKLFFSGGANSVRGYGYQKIGEVNDDKKPLGGESVFEIGIEPRFRISDDVGLVAFWEGGNVYASNIARPWKKLLFGYGVGVRYYTPLGPIRLDVAFPTKRRKTASGKMIDSLFNVYISIGQAF